MITERDMNVLRFVARYFVLSRPQIQRLCFPGDTNGRVARRRLQELVTRNCLNRMRVVVDHPHVNSPGSVYYPAKRGRELLAEYFEDERYHQTPIQRPQSDHVLHWLAVSDTHIALDDARPANSELSVDEWINEWDIVNKDESDPHKRFRLYTLIRMSPRLICAPDAAFVLSMGGHSKVFYIEQDRGTTGTRQLVARKTPGYSAMAEQQLHRRHFPTATVDEFSVLLVVPNERRRKALQFALRDQRRADVWKLVVASELNGESFFHSPIFYPPVGDPVSLVKSPVAKPLIESVDQPTDGSALSTVDQP